MRSRASSPPAAVINNAAGEPYPKLAAAENGARDPTALAQVQRGRTALVRVAHRLQGPVRLIDAALQAARGVRGSLPWLAVAVPMVMTAMYVQRGQRPPLPVILTLALPILLSKRGRRAEQAQRRPPL